MFWGGMRRLPVQVDAGIAKGLESLRLPARLRYAYNLGGKNAQVLVMWALRCSCGISVLASSSLPSRSRMMLIESSDM